MRGGGLDAAGEGRLVAEALHQRDRELADGDHVGDARAGDRAHQRRREHRDLGRPAAARAEQAHRDVVEESDHPGPFEEGAEQDEQEDVGRRHEVGVP